MQIEPPDNMVSEVYEKQLATVTDNMLLLVNAHISLETN